MRFFLFLFLSCLSLPGFTQEDEDKLLKDLEKDRQEQVKAAVQADKARLEVINLAEELKKIGYQSIEEASFMDERVVRLVQKSLEQNHMRNVPRDQVIDGILLKVKGSYAEKFLKTHPWILEALADVMIDKEALPFLMNILIRKEELKFFFFFWIGLIILSFIIKRYFFPKSLEGLPRLFLSILVSLSMTLITFTVFYNMFQVELTPTINIFIDHWKRF